VLGRSNLGRSASILEGGSEEQKVRSGQEVDYSDGMVGREARKRSVVGGGGGGRESRKDGSGGGELYVALGKPRDRDHLRPEAWG
jgi:hypothetical protein